MGIASLRLLEVRHWGFDGKLHEGKLIVHADVADDVVAIFGELYAACFPSAQLRLIDDSAGDDSASMAANNSSAFN